VCADPSLVETIGTTTTTTTTTSTTTPRPSYLTFNKNPYTNGSSRKNCHMLTGTVCPPGERCSMYTGEGAVWPYFFHCVKCLGSRSVCPGYLNYPFEDCCRGLACKHDSGSPTSFSCQSVYEEGLK
jgi:hypothetical protein